MSRCRVISTNTEPLTPDFSL
uniref:Uncharacterized protein n=1 Tax=Arundo donax TaxID=35708 RepID=A0A0A8ZEZ3_ARUDO